MRDPRPNCIAGGVDPQCAAACPFPFMEEVARVLACLRLNFHFSVGKYCTGNSIQHSDSP